MSESSQSDQAQLAQAIEFHQSGNPTAAEQNYRAVLEADPQQPDALHFLGVLQFQRGETQQAIDLITRAIRVCPGYAAAYNNLGNILLEGNHFSAAAQAYEKATELAPDLADAYANMAIAYRAMGRMAEAVDAFRAALTLNARHRHALYNLGNTLLAKGAMADACEFFRLVVEFHPDYIPGYRRYGDCLIGLDRRAEALELFVRWLERDPDNEVARHHHAALSGQDIPARASDEYVSKIFDGFAESFDHVLGLLEYRAPQHLGAALAAAVPNARKQFDILDAGCGTGLCAPVLEPYARRLVGVDLSAGMLLKAQKHEGYHSLHQAELVKFLGENPARYDLIVCADTVCYFGALTALMQAAYARMRPGGLFLFTVESRPNVAEFELNAHGRYTHGEAYVRQQVVAAGFEVRAWQDVVLRKEGQAEVLGLVIVLHRPEQ